jgi:subtilisin family serine protease
VKRWLQGCLMLLCAAAGAAGQQRYIVRTPAGQAREVAARHGLAVLAEFERGGQSLALAADASGRPSADVLGALRSNGGVDAEPDSAIALPEAPGPRLDQSTVGILDLAMASGRTLVDYYGGRAWTAYLEQPATRVIDLPQARASFGAGAGIVAVIDTGVDPDHPALGGALLPGYDFLRNAPGASEWAGLSQSTVGILDSQSVELVGKSSAAVNQSTVAILDQSTVGILDGTLPAAFGHGTMTSGLVHMVAPGAAILPLRAFRADGTGNLYDVVRAIYYAVDAGARVINMSFSIDQPSKELEAAIAYANAHRVVCVSSAGNSGAETLAYPAALKKVEGVGSTSNIDVRSAFSNYGDDLVSVAAPGEGLITPFPGNNYAAVSGTSFSTALVSGAAAMLAGIDPNTSQSQAAAALARARFVGQELGAGRLDLRQACEYASSH